MIILGLHNSIFMYNLNLICLFDKVFERFLFNVFAFYIPEVDIKVYGLSEISMIGYKVNIQDNNRLLHIKRPAEMADLK